LSVLPRDAVDLEDLIVYTDGVFIYRCTKLCCKCCVTAAGIVICYGTRFKHLGDARWCTWICSDLDTNSSLTWKSRGEVSPTVLVFAR